MTVAALLQLDRISRAFPGVQALREVSFSMEAGALHALRDLAVATGDRLGEDRPDLLRRHPRSRDAVADLRGEGGVLLEGLLQRRLGLGGRRHGRVLRAGDWRCRNENHRSRYPRERGAGSGRSPGPGPASSSPTRERRAGSGRRRRQGGHGSA